MPQPSEKDKDVPALEVGPDFAERIRQLDEENRELRANLALLEDSRNRLGALSQTVLMLHRLTQELNTLDIDRIAGIATRQIPELIAAKHCSLFLYDDVADELILKAHNHPGDLTQRVLVKKHRNTIMCMALRSRKIVHIPDLAEYEKTQGIKLERSFADKYVTRGCISVPLMAGHFTVGVLNFSDKADGGDFDEINDLPAIEQISAMLAMAIWNCRLFKEVQKQAQTDGLTKLGNHRAFYETLQTELHRSMRYGHPLGLLMLDVDSFKQINDKFGHQAGDHALQEMGRVMRNTLRQEDVPARYGGDEIAVILPETSRKGCDIAARRILAAVRHHPFVFEGKKLPVSVSIGVACLKPGMGSSELVGAADEALYRAKQTGKDRIEFAGEDAKPPA